MAGKLVSTSVFAKISRITRVALRHYDAIGLLSPVVRGENNYRYYSIEQLAAVNLIRTWQKLGMTLGEIKIFRDQRSPEQMDEMLTQLLGEIDDKIDDWFRTRKLLLTLQKSIHSASNIDEKSVTVQYLPAEAIILGEINDYSNGRNDYDALFTFYNAFRDQYLGLDLNYPVWALYSEERVKRGDWKWPDRYYFYNPEGHDQRPAGHYAIGYARGGYGHSEELYKRLIDYINRNGFEICGDAYEEYPLNEVCISNNTNYLKRILIAVRERK